MEINLGGLPAQLERPQTRKFAWPVVLVPELFATLRHLAILAGYLVSIGWEVYLIDPHLQKVRQRTAEGAFAKNLAMLHESLAAIGGDLIVVGHGLGGSYALQCVSAPQVRAAVALAPVIPGFRSPLFVRRRGFVWRSDMVGPPIGQRLLDLVADADPFQREATIKSLVTADASAAMEVARGEIEFGTHPTPRLVLCGGSDEFAPCEEAEQFARSIGAQFTSLAGRGHWLVAGRALERAIAQMQRFLVRALGEDLLLLYSEHGSDESDVQEDSEDK
jgi:predicted alpha/beta hydrolase family esterase